MDSWREADDPACPACDTSIERTAMTCPACGESVLSPEAEAAAEQLRAAVDAEQRQAPRWVVLLSGLALGIATAPLVLYTGVILLGTISVPLVVGLLLAGWLVPAAYLARLRSPNEVLSRGLYLVVIGLGAIVLALGVDAFVTPGPSVVTTETALVTVVLAVPAGAALLVARRAARRADAEFRGPAWQADAEADEQSERGDVEQATEPGPAATERDDT